MKTSKFLTALIFTSLLATVIGTSGKINFKSTSAEEIKSGSQTLRLLNVEDYIYDIDELTLKFQEYAKTKGYNDVEISYATTDTPETMYNMVKLSPYSYDLICPSDYMIQKLIVSDMIEKMDVDEAHMPHYLANASKQIKGRLDNISAINGTTNELCYLKDYAVGYMWGTLGLLFDPTYNKRDMDTFINNAQNWSILWNSDYQGISSIKDSIRDTYAIGLLFALENDYLDENGEKQEGFATLLQKYEAKEYTAEEYNAKFSETFNKCDDLTLKRVESALKKLRANVFGMEVDSGKQDIVTGKIGINFAWSGDAVNSMAVREEEMGSESRLYYSVPKTGSNIWMDAWCMPKNEKRSPAQRELAMMFLDFLSMPEITTLNMDATGYTPFTGGNEILDLVREWYDYRTDDEGNFNDIQYSEQEMKELGIQKVDLSYFFGGTLTGEYAEDPNSCYFYSDNYLPFYSEDENGNLIHNTSVGGDFFCQFPDEETITRCAVMRDFGDRNNAVLKMWEKFKSDALPIWAIILFAIELVLLIGGASYYIISKKLNLKLRKRRKLEASKN